MRRQRKIPIVEMVDYHNPSDESVTVNIATTPEGPMHQYTVPAGGGLKGPANYRKFFERHGLKLGQAQSTPVNGESPVQKMHDPLDDLMAKTREQLLDMANAHAIPGRGNMKKEELAKALLRV